MSLLQLHGQYGGGDATAPSITAPTPQLSGEANTSLTTITWNNTGADSYVWQIADNINFSNPTQAIGTDLSEAYVGLSPNDQYYFRVRALLNGVYSAWNSINFYVNELIVISVSNLAASVANEQSVLTWTNPSAGFSTLTVERSTDGINYTTLNAAISETTYTATGLTNGTLYYFRVTPNVNDVDYTSTPTVTTVTPAGTPQLNAPTDLTFVDNGGGSVYVTAVYSGEAGVTYVFRKDEVQFASGFSATANTTGLVDTTTYSFSVRVEKVGFDPSEWYAEVYTYNPSASATIESYGAEPYFEPYYAAITIVPHTVTPIAEGAGHSTVTVAGANFDESIVGKRFTAYRTHKNEESVSAIEFPFCTVTKRSNVVRRVNATAVIVDFEYNGKNVDTPITSTNVSGAFYVDNTTQIYNSSSSVSGENEITFERGKTYCLDRLPDIDYKRPITWSARGTGNNPRILFMDDDLYQNENSGSCLFILGVNDFDITIQDIDVCGNVYDNQRVEFDGRNKGFFDSKSLQGNYRTERKLTVARCNDWVYKEELEANGNISLMPDGAVFCGLGLLSGILSYGGKTDGTDLTGMQEFVWLDGKSHSVGFHSIKTNDIAGNYYRLLGTDPNDKSEVREIRQPYKLGRYLDSALRYNVTFNDYNGTNRLAILDGDNDNCFLQYENDYLVGYSTNTSDTYIVFDDGKRVRIQDGRMWNVSLEDFILEGNRLSFFDAIVANGDSVPVYYQATQNTNQIHVVGSSLQIGDTFTFNEVTYTVIAESSTQIVAYNLPKVKTNLITLDKPISIQSIESLAISTNTEDTVELIDGVPFKLVADTITTDPDAAYVDGNYIAPVNGVFALDLEFVAKTLYRNSVYYDTILVEIKVNGVTTKSKTLTALAADLDVVINKNYALSTIMLSANQGDEIAVYLTITDSDQGEIGTPRYIQSHSINIVRHPLITVTNSTLAYALTGTHSVRLAYNRDYNGHIFYTDANIGWDYKNVIIDGYMRAGVSAITAPKSTTPISINGVSYGKNMENVEFIGWDGGLGQLFGGDDLRKRAIFEGISEYSYPVKIKGTVTYSNGVFTNGKTGDIFEFADGVEIIGQDTRISSPKFLGDLKINGRITITLINNENVTIPTLTLASSAVRDISFRALSEGAQITIGNVVTESPTYHIILEPNYVYVNDGVWITLADRFTRFVVNGGTGKIALRENAVISQLFVDINNFTSQGIVVNFWDKTDPNYNTNVTLNDLPIP